MRDLTGPVALVSAGWRYDEERDEPLRGALGLTIHNLRLYGAFRDIERAAPELVAAHARKQAMLKAIKVRYREAIVSRLAGIQAQWADRRDPACPWFRLAVRHLQEVDELFLAEADRLHQEFAATGRPFDHPAVQAVRARIDETLDGCQAVLIAGGHVGVLRNRMSFFGVDQALRGRRLIAWSGGAMVLADRILLYHDYTTHGVGLAEYLDRGFGLVPGVVFLPHAQNRLDLNRPENVAILAARVAPLRAVTLENGGGIGPSGQQIGRADAVRQLQPDGTSGALSSGLVWGNDAARS